MKSKIEGSISMNTKGLLIVISGPSGTGKGTICKAFLMKHPEVVLSVSVTTRPPRIGELEGVNYFFRDEQTFKKMIENNDLLEYAEVYGNYYGTPRHFVESQLEAGKDVILEIDIQGALKVKKQFDKGVFVFIVPPSMKDLKERIINRGTESPEAIQKRVQSAYSELSYISKYKYVIVNDDVEDAAQKIESIIIAEKCRVDRNESIYANLIGGIMDDPSGLE